MQYKISVHILPLCLVAMLALCGCPRGKRPQLPSNKHEADSTVDAVADYNRHMAQMADKQVAALATTANDSLSALGEPLFVRQDLGYWLRITDEVEGDSIQPDDLITVSYRYFLPGGEEVESGTQSISVGRKQVVDAIDDALLHLTCGSSAVVIAPWSLLYGRQGTQHIEPYQQAIIYISTSK